MKRGSIVQVVLDPTAGHEQRGIRPAVLISDDAVTMHQRFPLVVVIPLTSTLVLGPLYPVLQPTVGSGLKNASAVLVDQLRAVDKLRIQRVYGAVAPVDLHAIEQVLCRLLGISRAR